MRIMRVFFVFALATTTASAQPVKTPEHLLPADGTAYFRYDGYLPHRKAYDQTALAQVMKEGLHDFLDHLWTRAWSAAEAEPPMPGGKVARRRQQISERFMDLIWARGFAVSLELGREKGEVVDLQSGQVTIVFPQGAQAKHRAEIDAFLRLIPEVLNIDLAKYKHAGREGHSFKVDGIPLTWWPEGDHVVLTIGKLPASKIIDVADGRRPNVADADWHKELLVAPKYETDIRGFISMDKIRTELTVLGREALRLANIGDRFVEHLVVRHLGLSSLRNITFHLGFEGKYQRSTVRFGIVEPEKRLGLAGLITGPVAFDAAKLPPLPPDTDYVSARHVDWERIYDFVKGTYTAYLLAELFAGRVPDQNIPDLDRMLGIDFRRDFLQQLDTTVITWGANSEGPFFLGQAFAVKVKDSAKVRKGLDAIVKKLGEDKMLAADKTIHRGVDMYVFRKIPLPITIALHNDWLVLGMAPQPVQGFIMRGNGKYRTWQAPSELAAVQAKEAKLAGKSKLLAVTVSDPRPSVEIGLALLPTIANIAGIGRAKLFDIEKIPNAQSINEWLFPNVDLLYDDGNALRWEHYYSVEEPDGLISAPYLGLFGGFLSDFLRPFRLIDAGGARADPLLNDPTKPAVCKATADEQGGEVVLRVVVTRPVAYTVNRAVNEVVKEQVMIDGKLKTVEKVVTRCVTETRTKDVQMNRVFIADGKTVRVTRKDGTAIEPKDLPKLLNDQTRVVLVISDRVNAEELRNLDEKTLIIRVATSPPATIAY